MATTTENKPDFFDTTVSENAKAIIKAKQTVITNQIFLDTLSEMYDATRNSGSVWVTIKRSKS